MPIIVHGLTLAASSEVASKLKKKHSLRKWLLDHIETVVRMSQRAIEDAHFGRRNNDNYRVVKGDIVDVRIDKGGRLLARIDKNMFNIVALFASGEHDKKYKRLTVLIQTGSFVPPATYVYDPQ